jgi:catabolite regulation protein CreA
MHATRRLLTLITLLTCTTLSARAERVGEVDTVFKLIGPDHRIVVDAYDDPGVKGVTLVYLTYSDRVIEGSPQNSVTAMPVDRGTPILMWWWQ